LAGDHSCHPALLPDNHLGALRVALDLAVYLQQAAADDLQALSIILSGAAILN
jgi:hypothetical protein